MQEIAFHSLLRFLMQKMTFLVQVHPDADEYAAEQMRMASLGKSECAGNTLDAKKRRILLVRTLPQKKSLWLSRARANYVPIKAG